MAAPPVKSQPLHNFSLPHLKWAHKNASSAPGSSSQHHRFRRRDSPDQHQHRFQDPDSDPGTRLTNPKQQPPVGSSRKDSVLPMGEEDNEDDKPWNLRPRREIIRASSTSNKETGAENNDNKGYSKSNGVKSQRLRGLVEGRQQNGGVERRGKRKVWISLSREEIEEDVYALTGGRPARRPRRWPKNVQKQLDRQIQC
ncbi:uncharacterized protein LOC105167946 isoform X2 [Sesamum indicum]|uniref:Uncharacterized protein LOC105167946 isoform X2 n=1 Tax=Sesamum indicum TaxID=4182 RepID=A0A8M8UXZ5_SESIN|nr:uncharacterized protein LOC105167946 isoform X2 [Sesamum indicum]